MNKFFNKKLNTILSITVVALSVGITLNVVLSNNSLSAGEGITNTESSNVQATADDSATADMAVVQIATEVTEPETTQPATEAEIKKTTKKTTKKTAKKKTKTEKKTEPVQTEPPIEWATALPAKEPADYQAQWDAGYLVAIDNPDPTYKCGQVTLSDYDRDLIERLCMGEFGSGGFTGAALIAQSVKNAICFDGFTSIQQVIDECQYTGRTDIEPTEDCKKAVRYVFDENRDAVQHRLMYMYNPLLVASAFHESQNYILTYEDVRFFDRWGY